ncbi:hypothetical protein DERP_009078 [Dermatophagoides pteronyssinus]|uniref:Uncharacterized protein n=1 Tax=Dermatophagoides pteronyssinus TaxID=6956 RepID=A0ABQ8JGF4_DERPT|nr:hypothetical protein DERP_009078 [Dermatophagoides pteronyssinus]
MDDHLHKMVAYVLINDLIQLDNVHRTLIWFAQNSNHSLYDVDVESPKCMAVANNVHDIRQPHCKLKQCLPTSIIFLIFSSKNGRKISSVRNQNSNTKLKQTNLLASKNDSGTKLVELRSLSVKSIINVKFDDLFIRNAYG